MKLTHRFHINKAVEIMRGCRPTLLKVLGGKAESCIFCTRVACGVFSRLGIPNRPLPVALTVLNPSLTRHSRGEEAGDEKLMFRIGTNEPGVHGRGWPGHLVCVVENRLILDLSIDQVNRPQHDVCLESAVIEPPPDMMAGFLSEAGSLAGEMNGCTVMYERLWNNDYRTAGDWDREHTRPLVLSICEGIEQAIRTNQWPQFYTRPLPDEGDSSCPTTEPVTLQK